MGLHNSPGLGSTEPLPKIFPRWKDVGTCFLCATRTETYQRNGSRLGNIRALVTPYICTPVRQGRGERELRGDKVFCRFKLLAWLAKPVDVFNIKQADLSPRDSDGYLQPSSLSPTERPPAPSPRTLVDLHTYL